MPDENERLILYRRLARAESEQDLDDLRDEMRDRCGPVPTLVENLHRRDERAPPDARDDDPERDHARAISSKFAFIPTRRSTRRSSTKLVEANRKRMRLTPSFQLIVQIERCGEREYEKTFAQVDAVLQAIRSL